MASLESTTQACLQQVQDRIERAARGCGRDPRGIALVAVSKTFGAGRILQALAAGQARFGENYLQEAVAKMAEVARTAPGHRVEWHFIGPIQSNKTRELAQHFDWIQSVDRLKVAQRLSEQHPGGRPALNVLLQVNISGEATKHGVAPGELAPLALEVSRLPRLRLRGLMAIPQPGAQAAAQHAAFAGMRRLFEQLRGDAGLADLDLDTLSMGMSDDLEAAIVEGSTMVRIGTAIFGART